MLQLPHLDLADDQKAWSSMISSFFFLKSVAYYIMTYKNNNSNNNNNDDDDNINNNSIYCNSIKKKKNYIIWIVRYDVWRVGTPKSNELFDIFAVWGYVLSWDKARKTKMHSSRWNFHNFSGGLLHVALMFGWFG